MRFFLSLLRGSFTFVGIALIAIGVGILFVKPRAEDALRRSVQTELSEAFGAPVTIAETRVSLLRRAIRSRGLVIASPSQFREEPAFVCDEVVIKLQPLTLLTGNPLVHRVDVAGGTMNFRYKAGTGTNIGILTESLERYQESHPGVRRYRVGVLESEGARVNFSTNLVPFAKVKMRVVNLRRENLTGDEAMSSVGVTRVFLLSLLKEAVTLHGIVDPVVNELVELFD